ncbi:hypothetical protein [Shewanella algidipiscicola]|uniref:Glycosyltransferase n=1 Tax=Shewanella algidipiscicola TaxID=614070 RepID=A0ABQ4NTB0_9GAMM|nr:hypothetical protein [Shewanella algidipiscicola]GIU02818.1 hypothetical protein TUM4630_35230 [Shewanella algidipiscicola]
MDKFDVITSFAFFDGVIKEPIEKALKSHIDNDSIHLIHIVTESTKQAIRQHFKYADHAKVHIIESESRPTFQVLIDYSNQLLYAEDAQFTALINGDVSFAGATEVGKVTNFFEHKNFPDSGMLALSRHEIIDGELKLYLYLDNGLPNYLSADAWIFRRPCILKQDAFYFMGQMNCDLMLASDLMSAGYKPINPCLDIVIIHHEDEFKNDTFYSGENQKESNIDAQYKFFASRLNTHGVMRAVPWVSCSWLDSYYSGEGYYFSSRKVMWLLLNNDGNNNNKKVNSLKVLEIIAAHYGMQINIVAEGEFDTSFVSLFKEVLKENSTIYFHFVPNINRIIENSLSGTVSWSDSFVLVNDISRLSENILTRTQEIIIDLTQLDERVRLECSAKDVLGVDVKWCLDGRYGPSSSELINYERYKIRKCSFITSMFRTDEFIGTFIINCNQLDKYGDIDHFYLITNPTKVEVQSIKRVLWEQRNAIFVWNRQDPGLYECWNIGIRMSSTEFVSNANVDDLRDPGHVSVLLQDLTTKNDYAFAASALHPFYTFSGDLDAHKIECPWYSDQEGTVDFLSLANVEEDANGSYVLNPHNIPHCMPIWRRDLHDKYGFFDEARYGTFADWAFWLKVTNEDEVGYLNGQGLGYYYVNLESHNRRGDKLAAFHKQVEDDFIPFFLYKQNSKKLAPPRKLNIFGSDLHYGEHRNSFNKIAESLSPLETDGEGVLLLPFIERYFVWGNEPGEAASSTPKSIQKPWVGIIHVPFFAPSWFHTPVSPEAFFETELWKKSLPHCKGIITLSDDLKRDVEYHLPSVPVVSLLHPTDFDNLKPFDFEVFAIAPTLVQAGDWLRKLQAIHLIKAEGYRRVMLKKTYTDDYLANEIATFGNNIDPNVEVFTMVPNDEYDELLSSSVVICWLYATAANNLVLECIARKTPLLINPLPSVVEYLGADYPLYINDMDEAEVMLADKARIKEAHLYLSNERFRTDLSYQTFFENFLDSKFYNNL